MIDEWLPPKQVKDAGGRGLCLACIRSKGACTTDRQRSEHHSCKHPGKWSGEEIILILNACVDQGQLIIVLIKDRQLIVSMCVHV